MTAYDEMRRGQDEWDNEEKRIARSGHGDIIFPEDRKLWHEHLMEIKKQNGNPT